MNAEELAFRDGTFEHAVATFVFCSVSDPVRGLRELGRVLRTGGRAFLLEDMRPENEILGKVFDAANPIAVRAFGVNINRRTMDKVRRAGLLVENKSTSVATSSS